MAAAVKRARALRCIGRFIAAPARDYLDALAAMRSDGGYARHFRESGDARHSREGGKPAAVGETPLGPRLRGDDWVGLLKAGLAFIASWFVYVPVHELLHAFGCLWTGGTVTRLEIAPEYGAALLSQVFPFVVAGSEYAGQLTGFDTHGNDGIYLSAVLAPFVLTVLIGVPLLLRAARPMADERWRPWLLGAALPVAFAPIVSLVGDYYEAGSIMVSRVVQGVAPQWPLERWRSDDVFRLVPTLADGGASVGDWFGVAASFVVGGALALVTYHAGRIFAVRWLGRHGEIGSRPRT